MIPPSFLIWRPNLPVRGLVPYIQKFFPAKSQSVPKVVAARPTVGPLKTPVTPNKGNAGAGQAAPATVPSQKAQWVGSTAVSKGKQGGVVVRKTALSTSTPRSTHTTTLRSSLAKTKQMANGFQIMS